MNEVEQQNEGNLLFGIIGAFIGALVAAIPWVLMYVYGKMILSVLAIIIAAGALYGYKIFKGPLDKKLPIIISITSVVSVIISTLIIIPALLLVKEGAEVNKESFMLLYEYEPFVEALTKDLIISIVFTILGISGVVSTIKKQVNNHEEVKIELRNDSIQGNNFNAQIEIAREAFTNLNALAKEGAVTKEEILAELNADNGKQIFNSLKAAQIIKKYNGKYYFSESFAKSIFKRFLVLYGKIMLWIIIIFIIIMLIAI